jgi:hypothetical protein
MTNSVELLSPELQSALLQLVHAQDYYDRCIAEHEGLPAGEYGNAKLLVFLCAQDVVAVLRGEQ